MSSIAAFLITLVAGVAVPIVVMIFVISELESKGTRQENYRGNSVYRGLGVVWPIWSASLVVAFLAIVEAGYTPPEHLVFLAQGAPLVIGSWVFGEIDDSLGTEEHRGFKGHLRALFSGRITTGIVKIVGIGLLALYTAWVITPVSLPMAERILTIVLGATTIAFMANMVNLFDLRPGRAMKVYIPIVILAGAAFGLFRWAGMNNMDTLAIVLAALGPVMAVWSRDVAEQGILGDAGANAMGACGGFLLVAALPLPGLVVACALTVLVNVLGERVSFTRVIASVPVLKMLDELGRRDI